MKLKVERFPSQRGVFSKGFFMHIETKGGKTTGRTKQRYMLLQRNSVYSLCASAPARISQVELRSNKRDLLQVIELHTCVNLINKVKAQNITTETVPQQDFVLIRPDEIVAVRQNPRFESVPRLFAPTDDFS